MPCKNWDETGQGQKTSSDGTQHEL
jgi:hypothetical protein